MFWGLGQFRAQGTSCLGFKGTTNYVVQHAQKAQSSMEGRFTDSRLAWGIEYTFEGL